MNQLIPDWRARSDEHRYELTRRSYRELRARYAHLAAQWSLAICNEARATLSVWDKMLRRARRHDPEKFAKVRTEVPRRQRLKTSLPPDLYRLKGSVIDITINKNLHVGLDASNFRNPLFWRYLDASCGDFGLAVTDRALIFNFRIPHEQPEVSATAGVDLNMPSADVATSDGRVESVDLRAISRVQGAMARKRCSVRLTIPKDLRAQHRVLRRRKNRERNRVRNLLHQAANELVDKIGRRNIVFEDLSETTEELLKKTKRARKRSNRKRTPKQDEANERRRRLSVWTHGQFQRIVAYKARTAVVRVNPRGTSSTCPRCGGALHHPTWRRSDCGNCQSAFHRDRAAAIVILEREIGALRGDPPPPRARNALLETAAWRPDWDESSDSGPRGGVDESGRREVQPVLPVLIQGGLAPSRSGLDVALHEYAIGPLTERWGAYG
ncbi:MAG TPA: transposase [Thermoplasmata archaeon]|nr:transposase [Thermoplasmata archaeon]